MTQLILIFVGGGLGAVTRFGMTKWLESMHSTLSIGTIVSNILSCIILGFIIGYSARYSIAKEMQSFVLIGFCGGFSTFSTFSYENYKLLVDGSYGLFIFNVFFSVSICIGAILLGLRIVRMAY
jgi:CrcB protein